MTIRAKAHGEQANMGVVSLKTRGAGSTPAGSGSAHTKELLRQCRKDAEIVTDMLEIGDQRLLASDGPINGQRPDLSAEEWGKVYRACKRITKRLK